MWGTITVGSVTGYDAKMKKTSNNKNIQRLSCHKHGISIR